MRLILRIVSKISTRRFQVHFLDARAALTHFVTFRLKLGAVRRVGDSLVGIRRAIVGRQPLGSCTDIAYPP